MSGTNIGRGTIAAFLATGALAACSGGGNAPPPAPAQDQNVAIVLTSIGNDHLSQFEITALNLTLTTKSGKQVALMATPQRMEFFNLNGGLEPLFTATLPQDTYVSASIEVTRADFACDVPASGGGMEQSFFIDIEDSFQPVTLASPIKINAKTSALALALDINASVNKATCDTPANSPPNNDWIPTPALQLRPFQLAESPTSSTNGQANDLHGVITALDSSAQTLMVTSPFGRVWTVTTDSATRFQGIAGMAGATPGMPVTLDMAVHEDGTLKATRISVNDSDTANLTTFVTELYTIYGADSEVQIGPAIAQGIWATQLGVDANPQYLGTSGTVYQISGRFDNIRSLPFTATFDAGSQIPGQRIYVSNHDYCCNPFPATTFTLEPQTINGTVTATSSIGGFTVYTVGLASYDRFPTLAEQPGQNVSLLNPSTMTVYVDGNTQMSNSAPITVGQVLRFNGLVFNDNGTLRMDAGEVLDGATL